jgi:hypothetical protein
MEEIAWDAVTHLGCRIPDGLDGVNS